MSVKSCNAATGRLFTSSCTGCVVPVVDVFVLHAAMLPRRLLAYFGCAGPRAQLLWRSAPVRSMPGRPRLPLLLPIPGAPDLTRAAPDAGALVADLLVAPSGNCPAASGV